VGGIETLFATILKYLPRSPDVEYYALAPAGIRSWVDNAMPKDIKILYYANAEVLARILDLCVS
jgi:hypothetical protein